MILGGEQLHDGNDYIVSYLTAVQVRDVADALAQVDEAWLRGQLLGDRPGRLRPRSWRH